MKNTILLILLIIGIFIKSQTHRYIYELQFKYDSTEVDRAKVNMVLDITPKEVKFYEEDLLVTDSINKKMGSQNKYFDMSGQIVKRKVNSFENENFISIKFNYYTYKTTDKISWNISGETKKYRDTRYKKPRQNLAAETGRHGLIKTFLLMKVLLNSETCLDLFLNYRTTIRISFTPLLKTKTCRESTRPMIFLKHFLAAKLFPSQSSKNRNCFWNIIMIPLHLKEIILVKTMLTGRSILTEKKYEVSMS
ncbi:hypothetical protein L100_16255 [Elizabethkingia meningoseptica ATCC 13253 = NBRC 12535]|nr:hypothetical protein L100_16255 [Elizabethkingia meningoseptica ATCC 13253 = NBRC 12535]